MRRAALVLALLAGCGAFPELADHPCPDGGTVHTYASFGERFFAVRCNHCHGGVDAHSSRAFLTVELIRAQRDRIYANATQDNPPMPPGPGDPPEEERAKLAEWLACGAP